MAYEYIDQLDQLVSSLPDDKINKLAALRGPASKPFVGPPVEVAGVQKEPESVVEAPARVSPIEYQQGYKVQLPQSELYRTNVNRALEQRQAERDALAANALDAYDKQQKQELDYGSAINRLQKATQPYERSPELSKAIQNASKQSSNLEKAPERDLLSEAILSFGPGLFAAIGGEDAALAAPAAQTQARTIYEGYRKEQGENIKERNKAIQDKYEKLLKIDSSAADDWLAKQKLNVEQARGEIDALKFGIGTTQKDIQQSQQLANQAAEDVTKGVLTGAEKTADLETLPMKEQGKAKRAAIVASGQGLKEATALRKEFEGLPEVKDFRQIESSYSKILNVAKNPSAAGDISLVFSYMKMLDPQSTVREGEFVSAKNAAGVPEQIINTYNKLRTGQFLSEKQRQDFADQARRIYNSQQELVKRREQEFAGFASTYGTNPANVIPTRAQQKPKEFTGQDKAAFDWAKKNPKDPRSVKILQKLGAQ